MKNPVMQVIEQVTLQRHLNYSEENSTIQLSRFFMDCYYEELLRYASDTFQSVGKDIPSQIRIFLNDHTWTIRNRDYRDDTNDPEVEKALYNLLINSSCNAKE